MSRGEDRATTFLLTALSVGCLTESLTRTASLMRFTKSAIICGALGVFFLFFLLLQMGLNDDN